MEIFNRSSIRGAIRSSKWSSVRKKFLKENPTCAACGSSKNPEVHHIVPVHVEPLKELDETNLITLCDKYCHFIIGHLMDYKSWNSNVKEDSRVYLNKVKNRPYNSVTYVQSINNSTISIFQSIYNRLFGNNRP